MSSLITDIGNQKLLVASPQTPVTIKSVAVGSGRNNFDSSILALQDQKWIGNASAPIKNGKTLEFDCQIPLGVGGFEVAEWGLIDIEGDLIAYGQIPETVNKITSMTLTPTFVMELGDSISAEIVVTDEINFRHNAMTERDAVDAHPMGSITGLDATVKSLNDKDTAIQAEIDLNKKTKTITSSYALTADDAGTILIDASNGDVTITMAKASTATALRYNLLRIDSTANIVTLQPVSGDNFVGEGFKWPLAYMKPNEPFMFFKYSSTGWMGVRGSRAQFGETNSVPSFSLYGTYISRLLMESNVVNNLTSTDTLNPLSASQGKALNDKMFGVGQTTKDVSASRALGIEYTNTDNRPRMVEIEITGSSGTASTATVNSHVLFTSNESQARYYSFIVGIGEKYTVNAASLNRWKEFLV